MARAQILDPAQDEQPEDEIQNEDFENQDPLDGISGEPQKDHSDLPEKYRGKSLEDVVRMHQEAEKRLNVKLSLKMNWTTLPILKQR